MDYVLLIGRLLTGRHHRDSHTQYLRVERRIVVRSQRPVLVQGDGEILGHTPITLEVVPRALRVCVPKNVEDMRPMVGSPNDPASTVAKPAADERGGVTKPADTLQGDVDTMVAQNSRTWVLQGWPGHPYAFLSALDAALYLRVNALQFGPRVDRALVLISSVMHYGEGWALVALVMLIADFRSGLRASLEALPVLWLVMLTVNYPLKRMFRRRRPFIAFVDARVLGPKPKDYSFPSGHTAAAFAGAFLFGAYLPAWSPLFYVLAAVVGFSRVYLGVHYPSDVVTGAIVGASLSGACLALFRMVVAIWS
jgi:undecaprenyl-diphosphatase